jgi:O-antigen ligase
VVLALISTTYAPNESEARRLAISVIQVVLFGNLLLPYFRDLEANIHIFLHGIMIAAFALLFRIFVSTPLDVLLATRWGSTVSINANQVGLILAFGSLVALYYGITLRKLVFLLPALIFGLSSLFSGSRKAIVIIVLGSLILILLTRKATFSSIFELSISLLVLLGILYLSFTWEPLYKVLGNRIETLVSFFTEGETDGSTSVRFEMIEKGWEMALERPVLGHGLASFAELAGYGFYAHNNYIELLFSLGFVGLLWYYIFIAKLGVHAIVQLFSGNKNKLLVLVVTCIVVLMVDDIGRVRYYNEFSHMLFALGYAIIQLGHPQSGPDLQSILVQIIHWFQNPKGIKQD